jgi:hypothetical protein
MHGEMSAGRRFAYGLAALAIAGMTLSTPAEAQSWKAQYPNPKGQLAPNAAVYGKRAAAMGYGGYVAGPRYRAYPGHAYGYGHRGYAHAYPRYPAYPGYAYAHPGYAYPGYAHPGYAYPGYAHPGYAYAYPGYGYPYGYYRKKRNNRAAIAAAVIGGMALGAILSSQARHPRKAYYKRRYH